MNLGIKCKCGSSNVTLIDHNALETGKYGSIDSTIFGQFACEDCSNTFQLTGNINWQQNEAKHTIYMSWGEADSAYVSSYGIAKERLEKYEFDTIHEANAFIKGVEESNEYQEYHIVRPDEFPMYVLSKLEDANMYVNIKQGITYQAQDFLNLPIYNSACDLRNDTDIVPDWFLSLSDRDYSIIQQAVPELAEYTKEHAYHIYDQQIPVDNIIAPSALLFDSTEYALNIKTKEETLLIEHPNVRARFRDTSDWIFYTKE